MLNYYAGLWTMLGMQAHSKKKKTLSIFSHYIRDMKRMEYQFTVCVYQAFLCLNNNIYKYGSINYNSMNQIINLKIPRMRELLDTLVYIATILTRFELF